MESIVQKRVKNIDEFLKYVHYENGEESEVPEEVLEEVYHTYGFTDEQIWELSVRQGDFIAIIPERMTNVEPVEEVVEVSEMSTSDREFGELIEYYENHI